jgi:putative endonuclease
MGPGSAAQRFAPHRARETEAMYWVYILASRRDGTLYVGVTNDLGRRVHEHREGLVPGFTRDYRVKTLVHATPFDRIDEARQQEARIKRWRRAWKIALIEQTNPDWRDLYDEIV